MKQVLIDSRGSVVVADVPKPALGVGDVAIATQYSLISTGTESAARSTTGGAVALARRAVTDPALRAKALRRIRSHGLRPTLQHVGARAAQSTALGYSAAGIVTAVGEQVTDIGVGQVVAAAGAGYANHAESLVVPRALVSPVPAGVGAQAAAYTTVAAVALHAFRLTHAAVSETIVVIGLGLVGQLAAQLASAAGCIVFGADPLDSRCQLAARTASGGRFASNPRDLVPALERATADTGADCVLITAAATDKALVNRSLQLVRDRGRVVVVGNVRLDVDRDVMYRKELELVVSRSYGPGRYDPEYEERGTDYPIGYVRWSEGRNFGAILELMARGRIDVNALTTATIPVDDAVEAYELLGQPQRHLGVLLSYSPQPNSSDRRPTASTSRSRPAPPRTVAPDRFAHSAALLGSGIFATSILIPALLKIPAVDVRTVVARNAAHARAAAMRLGADVVTDASEVLARPDIDAVIIATRHDSHALLAIQALEAGKHVFLEKPLGLTITECRAVVDAAARNSSLLMVDFNRRFSAHAVRVKADLGHLSSGVNAVYRVNAGRLPSSHWLLDHKVGGGRVLGEAVHFFDFLCWLFDSEPIGVEADPRSVSDPRQEVTCTLIFSNARVATLIYTGQGSDRTPKERLEVFAAGHSWVLDDYRRTERDGRVLLRGQQQKGHQEALAHFFSALGGQSRLQVTAVEGLRATMLALEVQSRRSS